MNVKENLSQPVKMADAPPPTTAKPLTPHTQRGVYEPAPVDPSGSKGLEVKFAPGQEVFAYEKLKGMCGADGIDPSIKEQYLADDEFKSVFGVEKEAFLKLPLWRRQIEKKKFGLF